jgi:hypothetical protein
VSLLLSLVAYGQTSTSRISGSVTDSTGAVVPGAKVTARDEATGATYTQLTGSTGLYGFPSLPAGRYTIIIEVKSFKTVNKTGNVLEVGTPLVVDATLEVGQTSEVVNVEGGYERLQTANATLGNVVEQKTIESLPLNGRNPLTLIILEPGVTQRSAGAAGSGIHVNGSRDRAYNVTIDGIDANESSVPNPTSNIYRLNPDNVQEYKVVTNNATASEGRNSGAAISIATRRGTNDFHGTVQEFMRNTALNANEWFTNALGTEKPEIKFHQYGFEVGGPIRKNKTHFFGSWQGQNIKFTQPIDTSFGIPTIYTPSARAGVYRYFVANPTTPFVLNGLTITRNVPQLVDPKTGALAPGVRNCTSAADTNCVASFNFAANDPQKRGVDATIGKLFGAYPQPNNYAVTGDGLNTATYLWNPPTSIKGPQYKIRIDHRLTENQEVYVRWLHADYDTKQGDPLNGRPQVFPGFPPQGEVERRSKNLAINHRIVIASKYVNSFTMGFSRFRYLFTQGEANPDFPNIPGYVFANASYALLNTPRTERAVTTPQFVDDFSFAKGSHQFAMGLNMRFYQHNDRRGQPGGINVTPSISFSATVRPPTGFNTPSLSSSTAAGINATDNTRLLGTINDVMGIPARLSQVFIGDISADAYLPFQKDGKVSLYAVGNRLKQYNFYGQDEWRVRPNLSLSLGVRFELNPAPTEVNGKVYVPNKPIETVGGVTFVKADTFFDRTNLGIGPRLGIAWSPRNSTKFVVRAGYGLAFDALPSFQVTAVSGRPPGLIGSCSSTLGGTTTTGCTIAPDIRIAQGFPLEMAAPTFKPSSQLTLPLVTLSNAPPVSVFDPNLKLPTVHQWNLSLQRELPMGIVGQLAYVGRRGIRLQRAYDVNQVDANASLLNSFTLMQQNVAKGCNPDGTGCAGGVSIPLVTSNIVNAAFVNSTTTRTDLNQNAAGNFVGRVEQQTIAGQFRINQQFGVVTYIDAGGSSHYHALQATLRKRFEKGLLFGASYSFQKSIDDQSVDPVGSSSGGGLSTTNSRTPTDARKFYNEKARSDFDRTHVFSAFSVYELPVGKGKAFATNTPAVLDHVIGGWAINGIVNIMTGEPFSVRSGLRTSNFAHESRADIIGGVKPELKLQDIPGVIGPVVFANSNGFAIPLPGQNGAGRNIFTAPGYWNVDLGIQKNFSLTERFKLQFRTEMFNAFNHPNFDNPRDASTGSPSFRSTLFAQTCCATVAPPSTQTVIQTGEAARVIQLALKLSF